MGWNAAESASVCNWTGVECTGSRVVEIKAEFFLTGDVALLAGVTRLEEIDLEKALVFGSIEVKNAPQTRLVLSPTLAVCLAGAGGSAAPGGARAGACGRARRH